MKKVHILLFVCDKVLLMYASNGLINDQSCLLITVRKMA